MKIKSNTSVGQMAIDKDLDPNIPRQLRRHNPLLVSSLAVIGLMTLPTVSVAYAFGYWQNYEQSIGGFICIMEGACLLFFVVIPAGTCLLGLSPTFNKFYKGCQGKNK